MDYPSSPQPQSESNYPQSPTTMTPQQITEKFIEQKLYESPIKWISASKRIYGECEVAEKKAELSVKTDRELTRDWTNLDRDRADYLQQIKKKIHTFKVQLDAIKTKIHDKPASQYDKPLPDNLESILDNYESKVAAFKLQMKTEFDQLEQNEEILINDILRVDRMITAIQEDELQFMSPEKENKLMKARLAEQQKQQQRMEEDMEHKAAIGELDRELAALGRFGGWDPRDHDAFLRVWNGFFGSAELVKFENNEYIVSFSPSQSSNLLKKLEFNVFGKTVDELKEHVEWFISTLKINFKKKKLINEWKKVQSIRKKFATQEAVASEQLLIAISKSSSMDSDGLDEVKKKENEEKRLHAKIRIAKWKNDKQREIEQQKLEEDERLAIEGKKAQEERKRRQMDIQVKLEQWKTTRNQTNFNQQATEVKSEPRHVDEETLRKRAERDLEVAKERRAKAAQQALKKNERERRFSELPGGSNKYQVESKLLASTKASEANRIREEDLDAAENRRHSTGAHGSAVAMNARDLQFTGKATPLWMKSVKG